MYACLQLCQQSELLFSNKENKGSKGDRVTYIGVGGGGRDSDMAGGGREDAIEHWTLPSDIIPVNGRQRGAEGVKPTMMEALLKNASWLMYYMYEP